MTNKPITQEHNASTGELIMREMTDLEFSQYQLDMERSQQIQQQQIAEAEAKAAQKAALLNRLGITEDEAKLLLA